MVTYSITDIPAKTVTGEDVTPKKPTRYYSGSGSSARQVSQAEYTRITAEESARAAAEEAKAIAIEKQKAAAAIVAEANKQLNLRTKQWNKDLQQRGLTKQERLDISKKYYEDLDKLRYKTNLERVKSEIIKNYYDVKTKEEAEIIRKAIDGTITSEEVAKLNPEYKRC